MSRAGCKKETKPIIDGTFQGPDEILEVLAMRLHQVGGAQAKVVAFRSDGRRGFGIVWNGYRRRVGLTKKQVSWAWIGVMRCITSAWRFSRLKLEGGGAQADIQEVAEMAEGKVAGRKVVEELMSRTRCWWPQVDADDDGVDGDAYLENVTVRRAIWTMRRYRRRGLPVRGAARSRARFVG